MRRNAVKALIAQLVLLSGMSLVWAQQETDSNQNPPAADNTKVNQRDRSPAEATADRQKENPSDRQLAQQIRRALVKDKSLSSNAHNVKVIAQGGKAAGELAKLDQLPGYDEVKAAAREHGVTIYSSVASVTACINIGEGALAFGFCAPEHEYK